MRCYLNVVYVSKPVDTKYETMNSYIPEKYFENKTINGYTKKTAPIFLPNNIGGYMSETAGSLTASQMAMPTGGLKKGVVKLKGKSGFKPTGVMGKGLNANGGQSTAGATQTALAKGFIVASPGSRGRDATKNGKYVGKAPAAIVNLKAAVRYLKYNKSRLVGDTNKIISDGTSAGGAMSALLASSGNSSDYAPYLKAIRAADTSDNIYGAFVFCPITNLENADQAYEWEFQGLTKVSGGMMPGVSSGSSTLSKSDVKASNELASGFPNYVNSLKLKDGDTTLKLSDDGQSENFTKLVKQVVIDSAQTAIDQRMSITEKKYPFLTIKDGKVTNVNLTSYFKSLGRSKTVPAFDAFNLSNVENIEFGTSTKNARHCTKFSQKNTTKSGATMADSKTIKLMNPMNYLSGADTAKHVWIRYGEKDSNTSIAVPLMLAQKMKNAGIDVNYYLQWNTGHSGDYDMANMFKWAEKITK